MLNISATSPPKVKRMDEKVCARWDDRAKIYGGSVAKGNSNRKTWDSWQKACGDALEGC